MDYTTVSTNDDEGEEGYDDYPITSSIINLLTPNIKPIAIQWDIDPFDDKLIDGYTRNHIESQLDNPSAEGIIHIIPDRAKHIIAKYYTKKYSQSHLWTHYYHQQFAKLSRDNFGIFNIEKVGNSKKRKKERRSSRQSMVRSKSGRRSLRRYELHGRESNHNSNDCMSNIQCMVHILWVANIIGTPIFAVMAVYYGIEIHNVDIRDGSSCDIFAGFNQIGLGFILFGLITLMLYCLIGVCICSKIEFMPYNIRLILSSTVYMILMVIWLIFYGYMFYGYSLLKNDYSSCLLYAPDFREVFEILIPAFTIHTITIPFFFVLCIANIIKSFGDAS